MQKNKNKKKHCADKSTQCTTVKELKLKTPTLYFLDVLMSFSGGRVCHTISKCFSSKMLFSKYSDWFKPWEKLNKCKIPYTCIETLDKGQTTYHHTKNSSTTNNTLASWWQLLDEHAPFMCSPENNIKLGTWICIDMFVHNCGSVGVFQTDSEKPQHDTSVCLCWPVHSEKLLTDSWTGYKADEFSH